jgi:hypothetical protein
VSVPPQGNSEGLDQLAKFANLIVDPVVRKNYDKHPLKTLSEHGVDVDALPAPVRDFLLDLTYEELRVLAHMQETMVTQGLFTSTVYGSVAHF